MRGDIKETIPVLVTGESESGDGRFYFSLKENGEIEIITYISQRM